MHDVRLQITKGSETRKGILRGFLTFGVGSFLKGVTSGTCPVVHVLEVHHGILGGHWRKRNPAFRGTTRPGAEELEQVILN